MIIHKRMSLFNPYFLLQYFGCRSCINKKTKPPITFSTCFYSNSINIETQKGCIDRITKNIMSFFSNYFSTNSIDINFNLVVYTNEQTYPYINNLQDSRIRLVIKPIEEFYTYKYKKEWIRNNKIFANCEDESYHFPSMLENEKVWFVQETIERKYFDTEFYGWCDIRFFCDIEQTLFKQWPNTRKIMALDQTKIYYSIISEDDNYLLYIGNKIKEKNKIGLPKIQLPMNNTPIYSGFFVLHKDMIQYWSKMYEKTLQLYLKHDYIVRDGQPILMNCLFSNIRDFVVVREKTQGHDHRYMFLRLFQ